MQTSEENQKRKEEEMFVQETTNATTPAHMLTSTGDMRASARW
jgi:hypothetical protein